MTLRERIELLREQRDAGMTLAELLVGMVLMTVFMTIFTITMTSISGATSHTMATADSSSNVTNAFLQLDKIVRYASAISTPSTSASTSGSWYVELQQTNTGSTVCKQLRLNSTQLSMRQWTVSSSGSIGTPSAWQALASNVAPSGTPFTAPSPATYGYQQLTVSLASTSGSNSAASTTSSSMTFTAVNSEAAAAAWVASSSFPNTVCSGVSRP